MPRVHTKKARKAYPEIGVEKGQTYYSWKCYRGPLQRSATYPRPSQLSGAKSAQVEDAIQDALDSIGGAESAEDINDILQQVADCAREVAEEYRESASAMESAFPNGCPTMEECNEKADNLDSFAEECEGAQIDDSEVIEAQAKFDGLKAKEAAADADDSNEEPDSEEVDEAESALEEALQSMRAEAEGVLEGFSL